MVVPPGAMRVAEVAGHLELAGELGVGGELGPAIEGDGPTGALRQRPERVGDPAEDRRRALVVVRQQEGEPALPFHQRGHVGLADFFTEDQQVRLPVAEGLPVADLRRTVRDPALVRDRAGAGLTPIPTPAPPARLRQVAEEAVPTALGPVDVAVDRLVADRRPTVRRLPL